MDNITHTLTGVMLERAGLGKHYSRATLLLLLAANAPDIDIVTAEGGALNYFHYHRWITHSMLFLPLVALLPVLLICAFRRSFQGFRAAWLISCIAVASHLLLDWTNAYGIRLLSPISNHWFRLDITNVVDLWIWAVLLFALVSPWIGRLVSLEIGAKPGSGRGIAVFALTLLICYDAGRFFVHERALATLESRIYQGSPPLRTAAAARGSNPLTWEGIVEGTGFIKIYDLNLTRNFDPDSGQTFYKPEDSLAIEAARKTKTFHWFLEFSEFPIWSALPESDPDSATLVELRDARFGFGPRAIVDSLGRVRRQWFQFGGRYPR